MSGLLKFFRFPFGVSGDRGEVPDKMQANGAVSYETGFGFDYERDPATDANAKEVPRLETNQLYYDITATLRQYQAQGVFPYITPEQNGGAPYSYSRVARCLYDGGAGFEIYESLGDNNTALPTDSTKWRRISGVEYVSLARKIETTAPLTGGGALTGDLTLSIIPGTELSALITTGGKVGWKPAGLLRPTLFVAQKSGTFTVPGGITSLLVILTGGGGSGANSNGYEACGGSSAGTCIGSFQVTPGQAVPYVIGAGGIAPDVEPGGTDAHNGRDGGSSTCLGMTAGKGYGGRQGPYSYFGDEMSTTLPGGTAAGGLLNLKGSPGEIGEQSGQISASYSYHGGAGADSFWGGGGCGTVDANHNDAGVTITQDVMHGGAPGAGGGSRCYAATCQRAGNGADGCIVIIY